MRPSAKVIEPLAAGPLPRSSQRTSPVAKSSESKLPPPLPAVGAIQATIDNDHSDGYNARTAA
jgi:hypothetical protein